MYRILIRDKLSATSVSWHSYGEVSNGKFVEWSGYTIEELEAKVLELCADYPRSKIRTIKDVDYDLAVDVEDDGDLSGIDIATSSDIRQIYNTAHAKIFG